ncbi:5-formyltetrahydrofolate cyclo-ligase [Thalassotalea sp. HSM 43]|uniref:5-formyltetrahydrofolate cyclo-ligase n=1 Tax=Thalassotalea sp. HSM 43 TaxID=2552945 RepID=UPI0010817057|nr:5-formyltetrahydrofolate cyclo-ligase [Thalassotalea sp. HSM 43]QBY03586.1 5-formyltetrahydrofolate cyclo-ligase [Thalassotalea sp. HSM 43]
MTSMTNDRQQIRRLIRARRQALTTAQQAIAQAAIADKLKQHPRIKQANSIALYLAADGELNLDDFIQWCWQQGKQLYLPVLHPFSQGHLLFLHYQPNTTLVNNKYQIPEPKLAVNAVLPISQLDIILTPLVAFDLSGNRMGMGGGFYDRTLQHWHQQWQQANSETQQNACRPYPIGVAHQCQQIESVPSEHWDIPLPEIIYV